MSIINTATNKACHSGSHKFKKICNTGANIYQECASCGERKVNKALNAGYQPANTDWLNKKVATPYETLPIDLPGTTPYNYKDLERINFDVNI